MPEQGGDGFEAHASVDGLGGQGVAQLVGVDPDAGVPPDAFDDPADGVPVEGSLVRDQTVVAADPLA
ncbi:MAG TPA: hypothetical protein VNF71_14330, partial [Acidimicrobiales bacterium]|nr:hypothetical protein [Acidimicrobiales bacterium]